MIDELVDNKIHDGDIAEEPRVEFAILLVHEKERSYSLENRIDFFLLIFKFTLLPGGAHHADHHCPQVEVRTNTVDLHLILDSAPE